MAASSPAPLPGSTDVLVVGAGISGLTAAFWLARAGRQVAVIEAAERVGGAITTLRESPWLFELGPNTVLDGNPAVGRLIEEAGLSAERLEAAPSARRRYLWKGERLHPLPAGPLSFLATGLFPAAAKLRLSRTVLAALAAQVQHRAGGVHSFFSRRGRATPSTPHGRQGLPKAG